MGCDPPTGGDTVGTERWRGAAVVLLTALLAAGAFGLVAGPLSGAGPAVGSHGLPWWALVPLFAATELLTVHLLIRRESISISFAEIPLVLGLAFCAPGGHVAASVIGSAIGLARHRRFGLDLPFNLALFGLEAALAQTVYRAVLADGEPTGVRGIAAVLVTVLVAHAVSALALTAVILLTTGRFEGREMARTMGSAGIAGVANSSVGLLVVVLVVTQPSGLLLVAVVVATLAAAYRAYSVLGRGHARLESLYRFTDRIGGAVRTDRVAEAVLREARDELAAGSAELVLLPHGGTDGTHLRLDGAGVSPVTGAVPVWWRGALAGRPVRVQRGGQADVRDGIAAPLRVDDAVVGVLLVSDRPQHLDTFSDADELLFTSLANHAALSLHKADLLDRLAAEAALQEHRSLHDDLTGLANRQRFLQVLDDHLATGRPAAVAMLDLDGFTDVNDAFGHATGDLLLVEIGRRLQACSRADAVARWGNDEFAVLLGGVRGAEEAVGRVRDLVADLTAPVTVRGLGLDVQVTAGLALSPAHGTGAAGLLQHADTALYAAKHDRRDVGVYAPGSDDASARLRLTGHLRDAIAAGALDIAYQPKVEPRTGRVLGAEALVRWTHPELGRVSPEDFVPIAERTGLIRPLTDLVLGRALAACAGWRADHPGLAVAVNLSVRSLGEPDLPARVRDALAAAGLPPSALTLEVTETAVMGDLGRSLAVLAELRDLGVRLSVDDFGTGQSSLAYLRQLPIHEMKIDKSFVLDLAGDAGNVAVVRAAIALGRALGLRVVAEGVEDAASLLLLAEDGCDVVQGFHIGRPQSAQDFTAWLAGRSRPPAPAGRPGLPAGAGTAPAPAAGPL